MATDRQDLQAAEYGFPYHHLPHEGPRGDPHVGRHMRSGMEYLAYTRFVRDAVLSSSPSRVLDVGCGDGRLLAELQGHVQLLVGVDLDQRATAFARVFAPGADVRCVAVQDIEETFDVVTCIETLEHIPDDHEVDFLRAAASRVCIGGRLVLTVPSTAVATHVKHFRHYDVPALHSRIATLPGEWRVTDAREIVPRSRFVDILLRVTANRFFSFDAPALNGVVKRVLARPVSHGERGSHIFLSAIRDS